MANELSCSKCKRFVKSEMVFVEEDGKTIVCKKCKDGETEPKKVPAKALA